MHHYHPRRSQNEITDENEKKALLRWGNHITLALCDNNEPYIVTLSYGYDEPNGCLYFHCGNHGHKLDYINKNPRICASLLKDNGYVPTKCDHDYESLIMRGTLQTVNDLAEKKHALNVILGHLEKDPAPILARNIKSDASYNAVTILRFTPDSIVGKKYVKPV